MNLTGNYPAGGYKASSGVEYHKQGSFRNPNNFNSKASTVNKSDSGSDSPK